MIAAVNTKPNITVLQESRICHARHVPGCKHSTLSGDERTSSLVRGARSAFAVNEYTSRTGADPRMPD